MVHRDRFAGGRALAEKLNRYRDDPRVLVLGLPRGGVPVAYEVARALGAPLDVFLVRKLGVPGREELAMGAVTSGDIEVLNHEVVEHLGVPASAIQRVVQQEQQELERQQEMFRRDKAPPAIEGRTIILVDDGLATGSTMRAAVRALKRRQPRRLVVAVPVGAAETCALLGEEVDEVVCASMPPRFGAVGAWYEEFDPTPDYLVQSLLEEAAQWSAAGATTDATRSP